MESTYVKFESRDWSYRGDKGTWARENADGSITIKRADKGIVSEAYSAEMRDYCAAHDVDWDSISSGESVTVTPKPKETQPEQEGNMKQITVNHYDATNETALFNQYDGQAEPQTVYIELDCASGELRADWNGEIGNGIPELVWNGHIQRWAFIGCPRVSYANRVLDEVAKIAQRVVNGYDGTEDRAEFSDDAQAAIDLITDVVQQPLDIDTVVEPMDAGDWLEYSIERTDDAVEIDGVGTITEDTTDDEIKKMAKSIRETAISERCIIIDDAPEYLEQLRDGLTD